MEKAVRSLTAVRTTRAKQSMMLCSTTSSKASFEKGNPRMAPVKSQAATLPLTNLLHEATGWYEQHRQAGHLRACSPAAFPRIHLCLISGAPYEALRTS